jgi:hypothetical protein
VQLLALTLAVTAITLCGGSAIRGEVITAFSPVGFTVCQPLPSWYPRGWELMVRYPCPTYPYAHYTAAYRSYPAAYPHQRASIYTVHRINRRPYLHPGWWW